MGSGDGPDDPAGSADRPGDDRPGADLASPGVLIDLDSPAPLGTERFLFGSSQMSPGAPGHRAGSGGEDNAEMGATNRAGLLKMPIDNIQSLRPTTTETLEWA
jgi:hypothetical protein